MGTKEQVLAFNLKRNNNDKKNNSVVEILQLCEKLLK